MCKCNKEIERVHALREKMCKRRSRATRALPDTVDRCVIYNTVIPSNNIKSISDISKALALAKRSHNSKSELTPRCVLPPLIAGCLAHLQNIPVNEHAIISLLVRWMRNSKPTDAEVRRAVKKYGVERHLEALTTYAAQCAAPTKAAAPPTGCRQSLQFRSLSLKSR